jgi:peptidoglycan-N-acetylglucosamine deacetylase
MDKASRAIRQAATLLLFSLVALVFVDSTTVRASGCPDPKTALGVSRVIEIDTSTGAIYGEMTKRTKEPRFLEPKEVVLTFDDGPVPRITGPILDALDKYCTKATFFPVGEKAVDYPAVVQDIIARGHTLGSHTWTHPNNLRRLPVEKAIDQIEQGFAATALASNGPIAPFFRFPGLSDSDPLLAHLQTRGIASFTVDVVSNDSYIGSPSRVTERVIRLTEANQGGILLFHDIKKVTAKALPSILAQLKARGYKVVHLRAKAPATPIDGFDEALKAVIAKANAKYSKLRTPPLAPALQTPEGGDPPVTLLSSPSRSREPAEQPEPAVSDRKPREKQSVIKPIHVEKDG